LLTSESHFLPIPKDVKFLTHPLLANNKFRMIKIIQFFLSKICQRQSIKQQSNFIQTVPTTASEEDLY
jgi:hypothetical protein